MGRRMLAGIGVAYLAAALIGHARERSGSVRCECSDRCWCQKPGLSLFRWVTPFGHRG